MTERIRAKNKQAATIKVLEYLAFEPGATASDIGSFSNVNRHLSNPAALLREMTEAGLIVRQEVPTYRQEKPYDITPKGRQELAAARERAKTEGTPSGQPGAWNSDEKIGQAIAVVLRGLPEFEGRDDARINDVSGVLVSAIARAAGRAR